MGAGYLQGLFDMERHGTSVDFNRPFFGIGKGRHAIAFINPIGSGFLGCREIVADQGFAISCCVWQGCQSGNWAVADEGRRLVLGVEIAQGCTELRILHEVRHGRMAAGDEEGLVVVQMFHGFL